MNRRNYAKELIKIEHDLGDNRPRLLLHACCGPCSSSVIEQLISYFNITILWYNPNIFPEEEFDKRYHTLLELISKMGLDGKIQILPVKWNSLEYLDAVKDLENEPEGGKRCEKCFYLRLQKCAEIAKNGKFDFFCSTLTVSRHKNAELINSIGESISKTCGVRWLPSDFKKNNGENRSNELSSYYGIYRQLYCGCVFSLNHRVNNEPILENQSE